MIPGILEQYREMYPHVAVELQDGTTDVFQQLLSEKKVDMYFGVNVEPGPNEIRIPLVEEEIWACVSRTFRPDVFSEKTERDYPGSRPDIRSLPDLPLLVTLPSNRIRRQLDQYYMEGGVRPFICFEANSQPLLFELARRGMGLAVLSPAVLYHNRQAAGQMISFPVSHTLRKSALSLVYRRDDPMPRYARDFIDIAGEVFRVYKDSLHFSEE